jgi:hypothetical protein
VHNRTALFTIREHPLGMLKKRVNRTPNKTVLAGVKKEMGAPRMARSARNEVDILAAANRARRKRPRPTRADS